MAHATLSALARAWRLGAKRNGTEWGAVWTLIVRVARSRGEDLRFLGGRVGSTTSISYASTAGTTAFSALALTRCLVQSQRNRLCIIVLERYSDSAIAGLSHSGTAFGAGLSHIGSVLLLGCSGRNLVRSSRGGSLLFGGGRGGSTASE